MRRGHGGQSTIRDDFFLSKDGPEDLMREKSDEEKTKTGKGEDESDYKLFLNREPSKKGRTIRLEILSFKSY